MIVRMTKMRSFIVMKNVLIAMMMTTTTTTATVSSMREKMERIDTVVIAIKVPMEIVLRVTRKEEKAAVE